METKVEALEDNRKKITVTVDAADVDKRIKAAYKDFAHRYNFPGFRRGKAPRPVIDNALGKETVLASVTENLINSTYPLVVEEQKLFPVGQPQFDSEDFVVGGQPFEFQFTLEVKPEFELTSYDPVQIELPPAGATDAEIEDQIESLRDHYADYVEAGDDAEITADSYVDLDMEVVDEDGNTVESLTSEGRQYSLGTGMLSDAFNDEILGMKKGEEKEFTLTIPEDETAILLMDQIGKLLDFKVKVNTVKERSLPEATDEWAKETLGFEDMEDLRNRVVESIEAQKADVLPRLKENNAIHELVERFQGEVPEGLVEEAETNLLQDFFTQLQRQGINFDTYLMQQGITNDQFKEDVKRQAEDNAKQQLALDAWARHYGIEATDEDVSYEFRKAGLPDPQATEQEWRENGRLYLIREGVIRTKAIEDILEKAEVTEVDFAAQDDEAEDDADQPEVEEATTEDSAASDAAPAEDSTDPEESEDATVKGKHAGAESKSVHAKHAKDDDESAQE